MIDISKISKNLIVVSLISLLMVFWLSGRFLSDAHNQFTDATQLQRSIAPEITLFEVAQSLDQERNAIQRILVGSEEFTDDLDAQLDSLSENTKNLLSQARTGIQESRDKSGRTKHQHTGESVDKLIEDIEDQSKRMAISRSIITRQLYQPQSNRDESVRMQLYDAYGNMIVSVNNLRKRTHVLPERKYIDVLETHAIKNSIWTLSDSINQTSTLMEIFLLKHHHSSLDSLNAENLALRLLQQHVRATKAFSDLSELLQTRTIAGISIEGVKDLETQYEKSLRPQARQLLLSPPKDLDPSIEIPRWQNTYLASKEKIQQMEKAALSNTLSTTDTIKNDAIVSLIINTFLVLLCMAMAYATFRTSKTVQHQADHDDLTGMPNRRFFGGALERLFRKTDTSKSEKLILMTLDLNGFKSVNDTMGHIAGDHLLKQVSNRLSSIAGSDKTIARMGGDEFAIAYSTDEKHDPYEFASLVRESFDPSFVIEDGQVNIDTSIGYSIYPDDASTVKELQITSDFAMFSAKQSGRKTIQPYDRDTASKFENRISIEKDLVSAIENNELELHYQPQFNLKQNQINSVEALIRWQHPTRGMVSPVEFIGIAEETGLMPAIGSWVLNEACRQAAIWNNIEKFPVRVAINVSVHQIMQSEFTQSVIDAIRRHKISPSCIELEITESVVMADINWIVKCLETLKSQGIKIALDDFGTGYSSLSQLQELPLDTLKIDRSFIIGLVDGTGNMKSVTATIASIAEIYDLETVAEGIETEQQLVEVINLGIDVAQGYYYSKPLATEDVMSSISSINTWADEEKKAA